MGIKLMVGHVERFNPAVSRVKELIGDDVISIQIERVGPYPPRIQDVGVIKDLGSHDIDLIRYLTGSEFKSVYSVCSSSLGKHEDSALITAEMENGVLANITTNWVTPYKGRQHQRGLRVQVHPGQPDHPGSQGVFGVFHLRQVLLGTRVAAHVPRAGQGGADPVPGNAIQHRAARCPSPERTGWRCSRCLNGSSSAPADEVTSIDLKAPALDEAGALSLRRKKADFNFFPQKKGRSFMGGLFHRIQQKNITSWPLSAFRRMKPFSPR